MLNFNTTSVSVIELKQNSTIKSIVKNKGWYGVKSSKAPSKTKGNNEEL